jgi:hypothetical protein
MIASACAMYANDNQGLLVSNPDGPDAGMVAKKPAWAGGWMVNSETDCTNTMLLQGTFNSYGGKLGVYLPDVRVFRCPADTSTSVFGGKAYSRSRSVSMNAYMGGMQSFNGNQLNFWTSSGFQIFVRKSDFGTVDSSKIYQMMEERPESMDDENFKSDMAFSMDQFGNYKPSSFRIVGWPGKFHEYGATVNFVDGHAELWSWRDPETFPEFRPGQIISEKFVPGNEDVKRIVGATTRPK